MKQIKFTTGNLLRAEHILSIIDNMFPDTALASATRVNKYVWSVCIECIPSEYENIRRCL